jgi:hypothetical protein
MTKPDKRGLLHTVKNQYIDSEHYKSNQRIVLHYNLNDDKGSSYMIVIPIRDSQCLYEAVKNIPNKWIQFISVNWTANNKDYRISREESLDIKRIEQSIVNIGKQLVVLYPDTTLFRTDVYYQIKLK